MIMKDVDDDTLKVNLTSSISADYGISLSKTSLEKKIWQNKLGNMVTWRYYPQLLGYHFGKFLLFLQQLQYLQLSTADSMVFQAIPSANNFNC